MTSPRPISPQPAAPAANATTPVSTTALDRLLTDAVRPWRRTHFFAIVCATLGALSGIALLGVSGWFITGSALAGLGGYAAVQGFNYLFPSAGIRLFAITRTASRYGERLLGHKAALFALATVRTRLFERIAARDRVAVARSSGETAAQLMQDVSALEDRFVRRPTMVAAAFGTALGLGASALAGPAALAASVAIVGIGLFATRRFAYRRLPEPARAVQQRIGLLKRDLVDYAAASPEIAAFALGPAVEAQLAEQAAQLDDARLRFAREEAWLAGLATAFGGLAMAAILALSTASLPVTIMATLAMAGTIETMGTVARSFGRDAVIAAGMERLAGLAALPESAAAAPETAPLPGQRLSLEVPGPVELKAGDRLAVTGRSGIGKTRMLETLAGWRDDADIAFRIDDRNRDACPPEARRPLFALAPQDAGMIAGSLADNLYLARPRLTEDALWAALETACLVDEVRAMPEGLHTWIGDGGARLSGGQRKRLSIARALLAGRPWLLLDEPSEGLDPATEGRLRDNLDRWVSERGIGLILTTHRPAMLTLADRHLDLGAKTEEGKAAETPPQPALT